MARPTMATAINARPAGKAGHRGVPVAARLPTMGGGGGATTMAVACAVLSARATSKGLMTVALLMSSAPESAAGSTMA